MSRERTSVSPELVLVDPGLAEWARERLPAPPDTLEALAAAETTPPVPSARGRRRWRSRVLTAAAMLVVLVGTVLLVGSHADTEKPALTAGPEPQAPAATTAPSDGVSESAAPRPSPRRSTRASTGARRFAWPPVVGATGYHVELFRGSALVFRDETTKPQIVIRSRWRFNGRSRRLEPGAYRWYVWPVVDGERKAKAIVQAKLVVPS